MTLRVRAHGPVHRPLRRQPGRHDDRATAQLRAPASRSEPAAAAVARTQPPRSAGVPRPSRSIRSCVDDGEQHQHLRSEHQDAVRAPVLDRLPARARPRHGVRSALCRQPQPNAWTTENWNTKRHLRERASSTSSSSRRPTCAANVRPARHAGGVRLLPGPARARRRCRSTSPTSARLPGVAGRQCGGLHARRTSRTRRGPATSGSTSPIRRTRPTTCTRTRPSASNAIDGGPAGELLRHEPGGRPTPTSRGRWPGTRLPLAAARDAPPPLEGAAGATANYTYARRAADRRHAVAPVRPDRHRGSSGTPTCRTRSRRSGPTQIPVGRGPAVRRRHELGR